MKQLRRKEIDLTVLHETCSVKKFNLFFLYFQSAPKEESTLTIKNPLLLQIVVYLIIGIISDLMSPTVALLSTHLTAVGICLLNYLTPSHVSISYLPFLNSGYLGKIIFFSGV